MSEEEAVNVVENLRKNLKTQENYKHSDKARKSGVVSDLDTAATDELTKSRKTNPFYPTHIPSAKYEELFMVNDKAGVFQKTSHSFRTAPRRHIDQLESRHNADEHLSPDIYNPKFTQIQQDLAKRIVFSQNQRERRTLQFEGVP